MLSIELLSRCINGAGGIRLFYNDLSTGINYLYIPVIYKLLSDSWLFYSYKLYKLVIHYFILWGVIYL